MVEGCFYTMTIIFDWPQIAVTQLALPIGQVMRLMSVVHTDPLVINDPFSFSSVENKTTYIQLFYGFTRTLRNKLRTVIARNGYLDQRLHCAVVRIMIRTLIVPTSFNLLLVIKACHASHLYIYLSTQYV